MMRKAAHCAAFLLPISSPGMSDNLYSLLAAGFSRARDVVCLELVDGTRYTYADLEAESARYANLLVSLGLPGWAAVDLES